MAEAECVQQKGMDVNRLPAANPKLARYVGRVW